MASAIGTASCSLRTGPSRCSSFAFARFTAFFTLTRSIITRRIPARRRRNRLGLDLHARCLEVPAGVLLRLERSRSEPLDLVPEAARPLAVARCNRANGLGRRSQGSVEVPHGRQGGRLGVLPVVAR